VWSRKKIGQTNVAIRSSRSITIDRSWSALPAKAIAALGATLRRFLAVAKRLQGKQALIKPR